VVVKTKKTAQSKKTLNINLLFTMQTADGTTEVIRQPTDGIIEATHSRVAGIIALTALGREPVTHYQEVVGVEVTSLEMPREPKTPL
jgi:hypothetical protein